MRSPSLLVLPLVLVVAACGGSSSPAKSAYLKQAEAVCAKANKDLDALTVPGTAAGLPAYVQGVLQVADTATTALGRLSPPAKDRAAIEQKVLAPLRSQVAAGRTYAGEVRQAVATHDPATLARLIANPPTGSKADLAWMRSYGFTQCVKAADTGSR